MDKIEKGMIFVVNKDTNIIGVVHSIKDSKAQRYLLKLTDGTEVVWNNKTKTYSDGRILSPLTEDNRLPSLSEKTSLVTNTRSSIMILDGECYDDKNGIEYLMISLTSSVIIFGKSYDYIGVSRNPDAPLAYFTETGDCSNPAITLRNEWAYASTDLSDF